MVRRIVDCAQDGQGFVNLLAVEEGLAALDGEAEPRRLQGLLQEAHLGEAAGQDEDVSGPAGAHGRLGPRHERLVLARAQARLEEKPLPGGPTEEEVEQIDVQALEQRLLDTTASLYYVE